MTGNPKKPLKYRSQHWFDNPANTDMTALYLERYLNYGFTRGELQGGKPIIGIAQTGSDLSPCNRHHLQHALVRIVVLEIAEVRQCATVRQVHCFDDRSQPLSVRRQPAMVLDDDSDAGGRSKLGQPS